MNSGERMYNKEFTGQHWTEVVDEVRRGARDG
jgi:hypothetical protein